MIEINIGHGIITGPWSVYYRLHTCYLSSFG
jgi:hypothetical protein